MRSVLVLLFIVVVLASTACGSDDPVASTGSVEASPEPTEAAVEYGDRFPEVLAVEATEQGDGRWRFDVTLSSIYDTADRHADAWRVLDAGDNELGVRELLHDHANEQPFTRSQTIDVPAGTSTVFVEGRDQLNGWSGQRFEVRLP